MPRFTVEYLERGLKRRAVVASVSSSSAVALVGRGAGRRVVSVCASGDGSRRRKRMTLSLTALKACLDALSFIMLTGITIDVAVRSLVERLPAGRTREVWMEIQSQIESGGSLGGAAHNLPRVFNEAVVGILSASEAAGRLADGIREVSAYLGQMIALRDHVRRGLIYPCVLLSVALCVVGLIACFTLPRYQEMLTNMGVARYNPITAAYFEGSGVIRGHPALVACGLGLVCAVFAVGLTRGKRAFFDRVSMKVPVVSKAVEAVVMTRVCFTFVGLHQAGFRPVDILEACARASGHEVFRTGILRVVRGIEANESLGDAFQNAGVFQPECVLAVRSGENDLGRVFQLLGAHYAAEATSHIQVALSFFEPLLLMAVVAIVFGTALAVILPLVDVIGSLHS